MMYLLLRRSILAIVCFILALGLISPATVASPAQASVRMGTLRPLLATSGRITAGVVSSSARVTWAHAEANFVTAWRESPSLGANVTGGHARWAVFVHALTAYVGDSSAWGQSPANLQRTLNGGSPTMGYVVQSWATPIGPVRVVTVSDKGKPFTDGGPPDVLVCQLGSGATLYAAQVLSWRDANGVGAPHAQTAWTESATATSPPAISSPILPGGNDLPDLRAWRSRNGAAHVVVIDSVACTNYHSVAIGGATLRPGTQLWVADRSLVPADPIGSMSIFDYDASFTDRRGLGIVVTATLMNKVMNESHASEHLYGERMLARGAGDSFVPGDWHVVAGPYDTLVSAVGRARVADVSIGAAGCSSSDMSDLVATNSVGDAFCATDWAKQIAVADERPQNYGPHYKQVLVTYTLSVGTATPTPVVRVTVAPVNGRWVITAVSGHVA